MYKRFVERKARWVFDRLSEGDYRSLVAAEDEDIRFSYPGVHALGSTLQTLDAVRRWYERLVTVFPGMRFTVEEVFSKGWPWDTGVAVTWRASAPLVNGYTFTNEGVHVLRIRWGRAASTWTRSGRPPRSSPSPARASPRRARLRSPMLPVQPRLPVVCGRSRRPLLDLETSSPCRAHT